ncbi:MAG TPA: competence protein ComK [Niallia sp.]|nr:competence protein ComK [Niallia sp.]
MKEILTSYKVNKKTKSLKPAYQIEYQSIVMEAGNKELYVRMTPLEIIKQATLAGGAAYNGRRTSMTYLTGIQKKVPIPISESQNIYAFPTCSPNHPDCIWIFFHHVEDIKPSAGAYKSVIQFKDGRELKMKESLPVLEKQMYRTWLCIKALHGEI